MAVKLTIKGDDIVKRKMQSLTKEVRNSPIAMQKIAYLGIRDINDHFKKEQGPGYTWKKSQRAEAQNGQTLSNTGLLRNSTRFVIRGLIVMLFNNIYYGKYHQFAKTRPKREFMWISPKAWKKILKTYK